MRLFLAVLALLSICSAYQRPWENWTWVVTNPYISLYGYELWFGINDLHASITSINMEELDRLQMNGTSQAQFQKLGRYVALAQRDKDKCFEQLAKAAVGLPISPFDSAAEVFSGISYCGNYGSAWKSSVGSALSLVEASGSAAKASMELARTAYDDVLMAGICDSNYTYGGSSSCPGFSAAFSSVSSGIQEGDYGKYALFMSYSSELDAELAKPVPDLSRCSQMVGLVWTEGGILDTFGSLRSQAQEAKAAAEADYLSFRKSALAKKAAADAALASLRAQHLDLITRAPESSSIRQPGTIAEILGQLEKSDPGGMLDEAASEHGLVSQRGYLAESVYKVATADSTYTKLLAQIDLLEGDAKDTVAQQKTEAEDEISKTEDYFKSNLPSTQASAILGQAKSALASGKTTLGERFSDYYRAAALARAARSAPGYQDEAALKASLADLEKYIAAAEKDGINVVSEKESMALLKGMGSYDILPYINAVLDSIISKARDKYEEGLLLQRKTIYDKLALAGQDADDVRAELAADEEGIIQDGAIVFPDALGHLAKLKADYAAIDKELATHTDSIVGNLMSAKASPVMSDVWLDEPTEITLDVVLQNSRDYSSARAEVKVALDSDFGFVYSDIISGKEDVESVRSADGGKTLILVVKGIKPFEAKRVIFRKKSIIAHTLKISGTVVGLGNDAAYASRTVEFGLDSAITRLALPDDATDASIDGSDPERPLQAGRHTLKFEQRIDDAYSESIGNIRVFANGMNSRVEYDVSIMPDVDLDSVPLLLQTLNDSRISSFQVASATGERLSDGRQVSQTQYAVTVNSLKKGKMALVKASYVVEQLDAFVFQQIAMLSSATLGQQAQDLLDDAKARANQGDYPGALASIEKAKAAQKDFEKQKDKDQKNNDELAKKAGNELDEINRALDTVTADGEPAPNSSIIGKLEMRKEELQKVLNTISASNGSDSSLSNISDLLAKTDDQWLPKELASLKKDLYSQYNGLKERFFLAGNTSTPAEFMDFEAALNRFDAMGKAEYGMEALMKLEQVRSVVAAQESSNSSVFRSMLDSLGDVRSAMESTIEAYGKEAAAAKSTALSSLFTENEKTALKGLDDAQALAGKDQAKFLAKMAELNKSESRMQAILASLKKEAESKLSVIEAALAQKDLDGQKRSDFQVKIDAMRGMLAGNQYVNAIQAGSAISKELDAVKPRDNGGTIVLGLSALAVLGGISFYMMKQKKPEPKKPKKLASLADATIGVKDATGAQEP